MNNLELFRSYTVRAERSLYQIVRQYKDAAPAFVNKLTSTQAFCFIQPDGTSGMQDCLPQYRWGTLISLWWKPQFTPTSLAPRGPPNLASEVFPA
jgi:hypothetical protein